MDEVSSPVQDPEQFTVTPAQAARVLDLSARRVVQLMDEGVLPCRRSALGRLTTLEAVEVLRDRRAVKERIAQVIRNQRSETA